MTLLIIHFALLVWISHATASWMVRDRSDRFLTAAMLFWGNIVLNSLLLSLITKLGEPDWFFRSSLILSLITLVAVRRGVAPAPAAPATPAEPVNRWLVAAFFVTLIPILLANIRIAYSYAPNNYDSLAYHLPRVMYYMGHNTLAQFESADIRQVYFTFNYNLLQLFCFNYSPPHWVINFLNVFSWVIAGVGVHRVSRLSGCSRDASLIATWLALTATGVLAQATSTTLDLPTAAALFATLVFVLRWRQDRQPRDAMLGGLAFGLAFGAKLTVVFFGPAMVLLLAVMLFQHWRRGAVPAYFTGVRAWILPGVLAVVLAVPFIIYNLTATGHWMTDKLDFTMNKPFSFASFAQTSKGYLFQLFFEPFGRFTFSPEWMAQLNDWYSRTFFKEWNEAYAYSGFYVIPPDLNEDHVWYGFAGPLLLVCGVICLWRDRRLQTPLGWLGLLALGWLATYFAMNKWSLYIQRYFLPAIMLMAPCAAAVWDGGRHGSPRLTRFRRGVFGVVALTALIFSISYLAENRNRPFYFPSSTFSPPKVLPDVPPVLRQRLAGQRRINVISDGTNERIYVLMAFGRDQRFTSSQRVAPEKYNLFSYWSFTRNNIFSNIAHIASHTIVSVPTKKTAGVEFLGTVGEGVNAFDYAGLVPNANETAPTADNKNLSVIVYYGPTEPDRFADCRLRVEGLNPRDDARVEITAEMTDGTTQPLMAQTHSGEVKFSLTKPFKRLAIQVVDLATGQKIGAGELPFTTKPTDADLLPPVSANTLFRTDFITTGTARYLTINGLAELEGPYAQWELPAFRWAKQPTVHIEVPPNPKIKRLRLSFNVRLQVRDEATLRVMHNGRVVQDFDLRGRETWHNHAIEVTPSTGENVIELRDYPNSEVPDWLGYLDQNPDVKEYVLSRSQPLEAGAKEHYETFGRKERRPLPMKLNPDPVTPPPESLYFLYRSLQVEAFSN